MTAVDKPQTIEAAIRGFARTLKKSPTSMLDARILTQHVTGLDDAQLILSADKLVSEGDYQRISALVERRAKSEPIAYIIGEKEFRGYSFKMRSGVLVPRPDSETLIDAAEAARDKDAPLAILDLGVGSGCLLISLLKHFPNAKGVGVDRNLEAVLLAQENAVRLGVENRISVIAGDWGQPLSQRFDLIISNPPYIKEGDRDLLASDILGHEDPAALFAGPEGIDAYEEILKSAPERLSKEGLIILELGQGQEDDVTEIGRRSFSNASIYSRSDLGGVPRALIIDTASRK